MVAGATPSELVFTKSVQCNYECPTIYAYTLGLAKVRIVSCGHRLFYCVDEPSLSREDERLVSEIARRSIVAGLEVIPSDPESLRKLASKLGVPYPILARKLPILKYYVEKAVSGYGPLYPLIRDPEVEEIAIDGPGRAVSVVHRRFEVGWMSTNIVLSEEELDVLVMYLARRIGKPVSIAHPYAEGLTPEGHRVALTFAKEVSRLGSSVVIRKHLEKPLSAIQLIEQGIATELLMAYLWMLVDHGKSVLIVGPTASGKTTLLQAILGLIPSYKRIVTIEDTPEFNLFDRPHWDSLVARHSYSKDVEDVTLEKLAKFALRRRPDVLVIGEIRGVEAEVFLQAAATGHAALATMHADSARSAIDRLKGMGVPDYLLDALDSIVVVKRIRRGDSQVRRVVEVVEYIDGSLVNVFQWNPRDDLLTPTSIVEVVKRSRVLRRIADAEGTGEEALREELERLVRLLRRLREEGVYEFKDVYRRIDEIFNVYVAGEFIATTPAPTGK
ncbi:type II secretion system protein E [Pyrolobus fumarii 1A]|uniref:Type II secretion system protein E n=1 Tax=Pyrolobus fumarii (strain DSM 11204 / 1A) TaxID=694429 RepID=G0EGD0_PYRF1|nr:type II/IV secretion system ATPase subunit [Pyrolobus fumarii]AEM39155.1 type II secretion system protein E [Pyrolobus fumarii 1A]